MGSFIVAVMKMNEMVGKGNVVAKRKQMLMQMRIFELVFMQCFVLLIMLQK